MVPVEKTVTVTMGRMWRRMRRRRMCRGVKCTEQTIVHHNIIQTQINIFLIIKQKKKGKILALAERLRRNEIYG
jgi:hypothetical protein